MKPSTKSSKLSNFLEKTFARTTAITSNKCVCCESEVKSFRDDISLREYKISGLCQKCQDEIFGK
jgi:hypothetical protein